MKTLYIIRHGETDWNNQLLIQGSIDNPLNELGIKQAESLQTFFADIAIDHVVASPLSRAIDTACISLNLNKEDINIMENFIERDFGFFEGKHVDTYFDKDAKNSQADLDTVEKDEDLIARVQAGLDAVLNEQFENGAIFCHSHVLKAALISHDPVRFKWSERLKNCAIIEFKVDDNNQLQFVTIH